MVFELEEERGRRVVGVALRGDVQVGVGRGVEREAGGAPAVVVGGGAGDGERGRVLRDLADPTGAGADGTGIGGRGSAWRGGCRGGGGCRIAGLLLSPTAVSRRWN